MAKPLEFPKFSEKQEREFIACCTIIALSAGADRWGMASALRQVASTLSCSADPIGDLAKVGGLPAKAKEIMEERERREC